MLTNKIYHPNGCTALNDAIGISIHNLQEQLEQDETKPNKISFFITTDGEENSST